MKKEDNRRNKEENGTMSRAERRKQNAEAKVQHKKENAGVYEGRKSNRKEGYLSGGLVNRGACYKRALSH